MTNQKPDDLEKKSRELAEREQVLNAREDLVARESALNKRQKVFNEAEAKLEVLTKQIKAKEDVLSSLNFDIDKQVEARIQKVETLEAQARMVDAAITAKKKELATLKEQEQTFITSVRNKRTELSELKARIKESIDYQKEQEGIVEATIGEWNSTLVEFRKEAEIAQDEKNKISRDIIRLEQDKKTIKEEADIEQAKLESLADTYLAKVAEYKASLRELDVKIERKRNELESVINATDMKHRELEVREKSVHLKEGNINRRNSELDQKERRLKMNYGIAGIDYEDAI